MSVLENTPSSAKFAEDEDTEGQYVDLEYYTNLLQRDKEYVKLLSHYVNNQQRVDLSQLIFKCIFFAIVCVTYVITILFGAMAILNISDKDTISLLDVGAALTGLGSILSAVIVLPSKIAEHLFPSGGNKSSMEFIQSMQNYDLSRTPASNEATDDGDLIIQSSVSSEHK